MEYGNLWYGQSLMMDSEIENRTCKTASSDLLPITSASRFLQKKLTPKHVQFTIAPQKKKFHEHKAAKVAPQAINRLRIV
jgi:hypothetical protein